MTNATEAEHDAVMSALAAVGVPSLPETPEEYREALYNALYDLACKRVIPPEIKLDVQIVSSEPGSWAVQFSDDLMAWLNGPNPP